MTGRKAQHGFTLVELVVVIVVVLLLALVIVWLQPRRRVIIGDRWACAGNLKQIGLALWLYSGDNGGFFPIFNAPGSTNFEPLNTGNLLADGTVYACPCSSSYGFTLCRQSNYRYRGSGLKDDNASSTTVTVAYDRYGNHSETADENHPTPNSWMNALFLDGHVEGAKPDGSKGWNRND